MINTNKEMKPTKKRGMAQSIFRTVRSFLTLWLKRICTSVITQYAHWCGQLTTCSAYSTISEVNRSVVEWIKRLLLKSSISGLVKPRTRKIGIHSFPARRSAIKGTSVKLPRCVVDRWALGR